jgi:hypothetical protein
MCHHDLVTENGNIMRLEICENRVKFGLVTVSHASGPSHFPYMLDNRDFTDVNVHAIVTEVSDFQALAAARTGGFIVHWIRKPNVRQCRKKRGEFAAGVPPFLFGQLRRYESVSVLYWCVCRICLAYLTEYTS